MSNYPFCLRTICVFFYKFDSLFFMSFYRGIVIMKIHPNRHPAIVTPSRLSLRCTGILVQSEMEVLAIQWDLQITPMRPLPFLLLLYLLVETRPMKARLWLKMEVNRFIVKVRPNSFPLKRDFQLTILSNKMTSKMCLYCAVINSSVLFVLDVRRSHHCGHHS